MYYEIMGGYNTADCVVRDRRTMQLMKQNDQILFFYIWQVWNKAQNVQKFKH